MRTCVLALAGLLVMGPAAMADFLPGQSPFFNFAGSGSVAYNSDGYHAGWSPTSMHNAVDHSPYRWFSSGGYLTYTETWDQAQTLTTMLLVSPLGQRRGSSGTIYVATTANPTEDDWAQADTFAFNVADSAWQLYDIGMTGVYGVRIEVTGGDVNDTPNAYQIGSIGFYAEQLTDIAYGKPTIVTEGLAGTLSGGNTWGSVGNMTSGSLLNVNGDRFYGTGDNQYVGVNFGAGIQLQGLLIDTCSYHGYEFNNFDVQVFRNGGWDSLGMTAFSTGDEMIWIDFGPEGEYAEQVRFFGNANDKVVNGIMAFAVVPEPMTMSLLTLGGLALLRRRR